jgi:hypothetical protein
MAQIWTSDLTIKRPMLYHLSYPARQYFVYWMHTTQVPVHSLFMLAQCPAQRFMLLGTYTRLGPATFHIEITVHLFIT